MSGARTPSGDRTDTRPAGDGPSHPFVPALLLMVGVVVLIVALAAASVLA